MSPHDFAILRAAVPYLHPGIQPMLRLLLMFQDVSRCMHSVRDTTPPRPGEPWISDRNCLMQSLEHICSPKERSLLEQLQMMENMMQLFSYFQKVSDSDNPMDRMMEMLSPEQRSNFEMLRMMMEMNSEFGSADS